MSEQDIKLVDKWEYLVEVMDGRDVGDLSRSLTRRGEDGWELVSYSSMGTAVFKRRSL